MPFEMDSTISIHAPREGGDGFCWCVWKIIKDFNPRPPRGGRQNVKIAETSKNNFNPRPPRGGRHVGEMVKPPPPGISIHAPREGGDLRLAV